MLLGFLKAYSMFVLFSIDMSRNTDDDKTVKFYDFLNISAKSNCLI